MTIRIEPIPGPRDLVGESPFWDGRSSTLYWVDIVGKAIRRYDPRNGSITTRDTADVPTAIALSETAGRAVVSFGAGVALVDLRTGYVAPLASPEASDPAKRLNEGKCDPSGRFWTASMDNNLNPDLTLRQMQGSRGQLFRIDANGGFEAFGEADLGIPNTMAWSPDKSTFYFGDTLRNVIWAFDYHDSEGRIDRQRVFVEGGPGLPDGSCLDTEGYLWNARFGAGRILRFDPSGRIDREIELPAINPTACTFGGEDLTTLYATSGSFALDAANLANPANGSLFAIETSVRGMPEHYWRPAQ